MSSSVSSSDIAVSVRDLSKSYTIAHEAQKHTLASEALLHSLKNIGKKPTSETFWALKDVSFDIHKGDVVGIIGRNGAGKSTLLKILSRITEPTSGQIDLYGRVGSLLEVGTGFHPELTGRENIYLNGAILGMTKREIAKHFDAIIDFSGVEQFLDTPVKRYSSGMYVRLAFAVAAHLEPEILIVDEVLAVGDAEFQKKCLGKMQDVAAHGRTILFVSHNMNAILGLCTSAIYMNNGQVVKQGNIDDVVQTYSSALQVSHSYDLSKHPNRSTSHSPVLTRVDIFDKHNQPASLFTPHEVMKLQISVNLTHRVNSPAISVGITNSRGERVFAIATYLSPDVLPSMTGEQIIEVQFELPPIVPGQYSLDIGVSEGITDSLDAIYTAAAFEMDETNYLETTTELSRHYGNIMVPSRWKSKILMPDTASLV